MIITDTGFKLRFIVQSGVPHLEVKDIDETFKNKIKAALSKRYFEQNNALDLTKFHHDSGEYKKSFFYNYLYENKKDFIIIKRPTFHFTELVSDYFCALSRPLIMTTVLDIIAEYIPNLVAINLNENNLSDVRLLKLLKEKCKNLKILYIANNKVRFC